jgi:uncharacterized protein (UPF0548 family)
MLSLTRPSAETVRRFLLAQSKLDFSYSPVGGTAGVPPRGYVVDRTHIRLGRGGDTFERAKAALRRWEQFRLGWVEACFADTPIQPGQTVAVAGRAIGLWWLNACRIVYVIDDDGAPRQFGFAYGTLPDHMESGEERFLIEWDASDESVWYDILAVSRPNKFLAWLGYPMVRRAQKRFARDSAAAMLRAVGKSG